MRLTTKGRFVSLSYLEQLFGRLRRQGIVDSVRGPGGGYTLARPMTEISVADIIRAVDEPIDATQCGGLGNCHDDRECMTHDLWMSLNARIYDYLDSVHLAELVQQQLDKPEQCAGKKHEHRRVVGSADLKVAANG